MRKSLTRRDFLKASAAAPVALAAASASRTKTLPPKSTWKKALIVNEPKEDELRQIMEAGFDGVATRAADMSTTQAAKARKMAENMGMRIHSVRRGWMNFNSGDKAAIQKSYEQVKRSLRAAQAIGGNSILMIPCRIGGMKMPKAWEFDVEFDPETGHLKRVVKGDNAPYSDYIKAHNYATDASKEAIKRLIPVAKKCGVVMGIENVWNNLWVTPELFQNFIASFDSKWVQTTYDIGNHVKYAPPEDFVKALGPLIYKVDVKDFKLNPDGHGGKFIAIREGSVNWPKVMQCLHEVDYHGWMTIEGRHGLSVDELSRRLDLILSGK